MSTRTERIAQADSRLDSTLVTLLDRVTECSATDVEKALILKAHREYSAAARDYLRAHLGLNGDIK